MSSAKRIPKRSIIGCRVNVRCEDGLWRHGTIINIKPHQRFSVKLDHSNQVTEHSETSILGPGFLTSLASVMPPVELRPGQLVYVTHGGREVMGSVRSHQLIQDCVNVDIKEAGGIIPKKLDEIRLMESRKSARLVNSDTDFSLLADFNIVEQRKLASSPGDHVTPLVSRRRLHSMSDFHDRRRQKNGDQERRDVKRRQRSERQSYKGGSLSIDVPGISGSRKRRTSESRADLDSGYGSSFGSGFFKSNEENLKECTAAMVLMNLSVSPRDKWLDPASYLSTSIVNGDGWSEQSSPPPTTPRPSPAPSLSHIHLSEDEEPFKRSRPDHDTQIRFQCTWRGCGRIETCQDVIEKHVRGHLGLPDPPPGTDYGGEEDFYYTELEEDDNSLIMEMEQTSDSGCSSNDGMELSQGTRVIDMCPSENFVKILPNPSAPTSIPASLASSVPANFGSTHPLGDHIGMARPSYEAPAPATIYLVNTINQKNKQQLAKDHIYNSNSFQGKKLVSIIPRPDTSSSPVTSSTSSSESESSSATFVFKSVSGTVKSDKKCRKVYGIDQKDLWCTQCKWKKACGRFT